MDKAKSIKQGAIPAKTGRDGKRAPSANSKYFPGAYGFTMDWMRVDAKSTAVRFDALKFGDGRY